MQNNLNINNNIQEPLLSDGDSYQEPIIHHDQLVNEQEPQQQQIQDQENYEEQQDEQEVPNQQQLLQQQLGEAQRRPSKVYIKAVKHLQTSTLICFVYQWIKFIVPFVIVISQNCQWSQLESWCMVIMSHSIMACVYYYDLYKLSKNREKMLDLAEKLNHVQYINSQYLPDNAVPNVQVEELPNIIPGYNDMSQEEQQQYINQLNQQQDIFNEEEGYDDDQENGQFDQNGEEDELEQNNQTNTEEKNRKVAMLSQEIKFEAKKEYRIAKFIGNFQFIYMFAVQIWGIVLFFTQQYEYQIFDSSEGDSSCHLPAQVFMMILLLFHVFQYFDFYLGIILFVIFSPFILLFAIFWCVKSYLKKRKNQSISNKLKAVKFSSSLIPEGENKECTICYSEYDQSDKLIFLPCEGKHHFHENCIREWLKVNPTCPLCRTNFSEDDVENQEE